MEMWLNAVRRMVLLTNSEQTVVRLNVVCIKAIYGDQISRPVSKGGRFIIIICTFIRSWERGMR